MTLSQVYADSVAVLAEPVRGLRLLLWAFSGAGFPGGDGVAEAMETLPGLGVEAVYTHRHDPERYQKLAQKYDVAIICNTNVNELLNAPPDLWRCAPERALWFWDLRAAYMGTPLRGRVTRVFLAQSGPWTSPHGELHCPDDWERTMRCPVGYCPRASPMRVTPAACSLPAPGVLFVGDLNNYKYHTGRVDLCNAVGATVLNARDRDSRLEIESAMPLKYFNARACLSTSPLAPGYTSVRTYSILACGGLLMLQRFPDCERLFGPEHAVIFDDPREAAQRVDYMSPGERTTMAVAGRRLHASRHTVTHRILSICHEIAGLTTGFNGWR